MQQVHHRRGSSCTSASRCHPWPISGVRPTYRVSAVRSRWPIHGGISPSAIRRAGVLEGLFSRRTSAYSRRCRPQSFRPASMQIHPCRKWSTHICQILRSAAATGSIQVSTEFSLARGCPGSFVQGTTCQPGAVHEMLTTWLSSSPFGPSSSRSLISLQCAPLRNRWSWTTRSLRSLSTISSA